MTNPTAYISGSLLLCAIAVTSAWHALSLHRPNNSPFFTSQHSTSSLAPTMARPAPVDRVLGFGACSSGLQTVFEEAEVITPNVFECSYFLRSLVIPSHQQGYGETHLQVGLDHSCTLCSVSGTFLKQRPRPTH